MKLGKLPAVVDPKVPVFSRACTPPVPPVTADWCSKVADWPLDKNDTVGDCTIAAAQHLIQAWTTYAGNPVIVSEADVLAAYSAISGYNGTPATDVGCVELSVLKYWQATGIGGHKINSFAALNIANLNEIKAAINWFGGIYIGVRLPISAQTQPAVWDVVPGSTGIPGSWGGHAVCVQSYDATGITVISWGKTIKMTWAFWLAYVDEAYAVVSTDFLNAQGVDPQGLTLANLIADEALLAANVSGPSDALVTFINAATAPSSGVGALLAPNLLLTAAPEMALGGINFPILAGGTQVDGVTAVQAGTRYALGLLSTPYMCSGYLGYMSGWSGGQATIAYGNNQFASQVFAPDFTTTVLANSAGGLVIVGTSIVGVMITTSSAYIFSSADIDQIESFITTLTGAAPAIVRLYGGILGRYPTIAENQWYTKNLYLPAYNASPGSALHVLGNNLGILYCFTHSPEFMGGSSGYGKDPVAYVTYLYQNALGRSPSTSELTWYVAQLKSRDLWDVVALNITQSDEARAYNGVWNQQ